MILRVRQKKRVVRFSGVGFRIWVFRFRVWAQNKNSKLTGKDRVDADAIRGVGLE